MILDLSYGDNRKKRVDLVVTVSVFTFKEPEELRDEIEDELNSFLTDKDGGYEKYEVNDVVIEKVEEAKKGDTEIILDKFKHTNPGLFEKAMKKY